jgi:predicted nucleic acid-binding protein
MYLLDTNILSELVKKNPNPNLMIRLESIPSASFYTASICVMELRYGVLRRGNPSDLWSRIEKSILSKIRILNFSYKDALKAAEVLSELYSIGQPIGIEDVMIGSMALSNGLVLVSANIKHFSRIPNLKSENWLL